MTSHLDRHTTTDVKPDMLSGVQTGNRILHDRYNVYAALPMCAQTEKTTFSCKDDCALTKHTRCWTYSALRYSFNPKYVLKHYSFELKIIFHPRLLFHPKINFDIKFIWIQNMFQAKLLGSKTFDSNSLSAEITFHQNVFLDP